MSHPSPTYQDELVIVTQPLLSSAMARAAEIVYGVRDDTNLSDQNIADAVQTAFNARFAPHFDSNVTIEPPTIRSGNGSATFGTATASGAAVVGGTVQNSVPPNVAVLMKKATGFGGRKNRGRMYFPWYVDVTHVDEAGIIAGATVAALQTASTGFVADLTAAGVPFIIVNKTIVPAVGSSKAYVSAYTIGPDVTSLTIEGQVATQRRRLGR